MQRTLATCLTPALLLAPASAQLAPVTWAQEHLGGTSEQDDRFAHALASGDFNGDGRDDLAIGAPRESLRTRTRCGAVTVVFGTPAGLDRTQTTRLTQSADGAQNEDDDRFGQTLAVGDFDGDGLDDLAVGAPGESLGGASGAGRVIVFRGRTNGFGQRTEGFSQASSGASNEAGDAFGSALAAADFDQDGFDDLAIGLPGEDRSGDADIGRVIVMFGSADGLLPARHEGFTQESSGALNEGGDRFGASLACADFDSDGFADLAVGVPGEDTGGATDTGRVVIFFGSSSGLLPARTEGFTQNADGASNENGDGFAGSLAAADFNADGFGDLAVGVAMEDTDGASDTGRVIVHFGSPQGLWPATTEGFTQRIAGDANENGDRFGHTLEVGDFDGDGFADLLIGTPFEDGSEGGDRGKVTACFGSGRGLKPARAHTFSLSRYADAKDAGDRFGWAMAAGDFDGDGIDEAAIGAPRRDRVDGPSNAGLVAVGDVEPGLPLIGASAAIAIDRTTGRVLGVKNPDLRRANASTTKIMTGWLTAEAVARGRMSANEEVIVSPSADRGVVGGSDVGSRGLRQGDRISVGDLLRGLMLPSGNEAAVALAEAMDGTEARFIDRMNGRAFALGLTNTSYANAYGRDPEDVTPGCSGNMFDVPKCAHFASARDLATLARHALDEPLFATVASTSSYTTTTWRDVAGADVDETLNNTNRLIRPGSSRFYPGAYGVKTGTTGRAGQCLVSAAAVGGRDVVVVVLGSDDRYADSRVILDWVLSLP